MPELPPRAPIADKPLSVVLVAVAAVPDLADIVRKWTAYLAGSQREHEVIVVVHRQDRAAALEALAEPRLRALTVDETAGYGTALRAGIQAARLPLVLTMTADAAWQPEHLQALLERVDLVDLVAGCRAGRPMPPLLRILGFIYRWTVRLLFGIPLEPWPGWLGWRGYCYQRFIRFLFGVRLSDVDCPFLLARRQLFERLPIQSSSSLARAEILAKATFLTCPVDEAPLAVPATSTPDGRWLADARRLFFHPDFGPPPR